MDKDLWTRRSNTSKLSLNTPSATSTSTSNGNDQSSSASRPFKRLGPDSATTSHSSRNPFNISSPSTALPSPTTAKSSGAGSGFGFGTGAFANFNTGSTGSKTPKTPGTGQSNTFGTVAKTPTVEKTKDDATTSAMDKSDQQYPLANSWVFWSRHVKSANHNNASQQAYQDSIVQRTKPLTTLNAFFCALKYTKRPSDLNPITEMHFFREGVRPIWEDEENKDGGKWTIRLKKGVADRYWEALLMAIVGDQFGKADKKDDEVMGVVVAVRNGEDVLSLWLKSEKSNIRIRDTLKRELQCPANTVIEWRSHNGSIDAERKERPQVDRQQSQRGGNATAANTITAASTSRPDDRR